MANYQNIKSAIVLHKDPLIKEPKTVKVSAVPKSTGADATKPINLEVYANDETKRVMYLVLTCLTVFIQTSGKMFSHTKMVCLHEHFVLHGCDLLSTYWRKACTKNNDNKTGGIQNNGSFALIMKEFKN